MARLGNPLVYDLLEVADTLAAQRGRKNLRKASMRRAVSSAYYAVFHALCFVCTSEFVGWGKANDLLEPVYRMLDHGSAKNRLTGKEAAAMSPAILKSVRASRICRRRGMRPTIERQRSKSPMTGRSARSRMRVGSSI